MPGTDRRRGRAPAKFRSLRPRNVPAETKRHGGHPDSRGRHSLWSYAISKWPRFPNVYEISTWVWLADLKQYGSFTELGRRPRNGMRSRISDLTFGRWATGNAVRPASKSRAEPWTGGRLRACPAGFSPTGRCRISVLHSPVCRGQALPRRSTESLRPDRMARVGRRPSAAPDRWWTSATELHRRARRARWNDVQDETVRLVGPFPTTLSSSARRDAGQRNLRRAKSLGVPLLPVRPPAAATCVHGRLTW